MGKPSICVVVPSYNHARFLGAALDSALAQSLPADEILVVDDGSTDGTRGVLERYAQRTGQHAGTRIRVILRERAGIGATYELGARQASGDLVAFLESDDALEPTYLERTAAFLESHPEMAWVSTARAVIDGSGTRTGEFSRKRSPGNAFTTATLLRRDLGFASTPVVRRASLPDLTSLGAGGYAVDCDLSLRFSLSHAMGYLDEPLYLYRRHGQNASGRRMRDAREILRVLERLSAEHPAELRENRSAFLRCLATQQGRAATASLEDPTAPADEALALLRTALHNDPLRMKNLRRFLLARVLGARVYGGLRARMRGARKRAPSERNAAGTQT